METKKRKHIVIDVTKNPQLVKQLKEKAQKEKRTISNLVFYLLVTHPEMATTKGEN